MKWEIIKVDASKFEGGHFINTEEGDGNDTITKVTGMYKIGFDYASYVILNVLYQLLKTVLSRCNVACPPKLDDSYNTMQYHPHADASIGDNGM
jgi:topoisomerase-4 subunit A